MKFFALVLIAIIGTSCVSTESTLKNIDSSALRPLFKNNQYIITEYANDAKYGFDADYPINIGFINEKLETINVEYYFNGLEGPNGEKISFKKIDTCCPFPTKNTTMGAGTLGIYEITFAGSSKKMVLYFNTFEKGKIVCPKGLTIKKQIEN